MMTALDFDERLLRRRKAMVSWMIAMTALVLLGFIFGAWRFLRDMGSYLDEELGKRLVSVATLTASVIESDELPYEIESERLPLVRTRLSEILAKVHAEHQLQGVYLVDPNYDMMASSLAFLKPGDRLSFLEEDSTTVSEAFSGVPSPAALHIVEGNRFKSAYAPLWGPFNDVIAVVVVQANADFFKLLGNFQGGLIVGGVISSALAITLCIFLFWAITRLIRTHDSLRQNERLAAMGQMAATVAHEIRNPLGIIKGTADVLKNRFGGDAETDELLEFIPSEVRRLNRLVGDFLTFSRDRELNTEAVDLRQSIEKSLNSLQDEMSVAGIKLKKDFDEIPEVRHDEDAVNQIILNLTLNAIQAMPDGGEIAVRLKNDTKLSKQHKQHVRIEVQDNGPGFEVNNHKIFEPFYTTKTSGSGLGLAIIKRLIERHNGWIEAESKSGTGTTMRFYLPAT